MDFLFIFVFIFNISSIVLMACEAKKRHKIYGLYSRNMMYTIDELRNHKETIKVLVCIGISGGILLWGLIIGLIISLFSWNFNSLLNSLYISATLSFLPSSLGLLNMYKQRRNSEQQH